MFYSDAILSKRGPLGRVWLAAHMERKLSKTQTLQTDISESVGAIIGGEVEVMALRLSGQLLLGVVRIYNRKAKYLLDDCNEAMLKLKMAFRAGVVDMTNAQLTVDRHAITLSGDTLVDLDLLPDINWDIDFDEEFQQQGRRTGSSHVARQADITLASADDLQFDYHDVVGLDIGPSDGIGSQDFELDLGIDFGDVPPSDLPPSEQDSIEMGRDAPRARGPRESLASHLLGRDDTAMDIDLDILSRRTRDPSEQRFDSDMNLDFGDGGPMDLDLGISFGDEDREKTPGVTRSPSSPLSSPPQTPPQDFNLELPPVGEGAEGEGAEGAEGAATKEKKPRKEKKQIVDAVTELADGPGAQLGRGRGKQAALPVPKDNSAILAPARFLPRDPLVARLLQIRADPLAHFLPTTAGTDDTPTMFCAAPPGLAPELAELFMRPVRGAQQHKRRAGAEPKDGAEAKKRRVGGAEPDEVEDVRRLSVAPSVVGSDILGGRASSVVPGIGGDLGAETSVADNFQMDLPPLGVDDLDLPRASSIAPEERARSRSRFSTPGGDDAEDGLSYADAACPIAMFDVRQSQSQAEGTPSDEATEDGKGYSKNTVKALGLIRRELQPSEETEEEKVMSYAKMSNKASRRAAAGFFFELLVLSTRDCISVDQVEPFADIKVHAKDKLWERQRHSSTAPASAARSVASAMGL